MADWRALPCGVADLREMHCKEGRRKDQPNMPSSHILRICVCLGARKRFGRRKNSSQGLQLTKKHIVWMVLFVCVGAHGDERDGNEDEWKGRDWNS